MDDDRFLASIDALQIINRLNDISKQTAAQLAITGGLAPESGADGGGMVTPPGHWNQIAVDAALQ